MTYDEAVSLGRQYCAHRGYACDLKEAHMTGDGVWKVKFEVEGGLKGHVHLDYNAYSRGLIKSDEKVKERHGKGHGKGHGRDDDD